MTYLGTTE